MDTHLRIRAWRCKLGFTRKILAEKADVSVSLLSYWESGAVTPPVPVLHRVCEKAFGITLARFFGALPKERKPSIRPGAGARA